jgi:DnaJ-class molecular chaperone
MFKDYYSILKIEPPVTKKEIKSAYRKQCLEWHPDRNPDNDTTEIMQDIIEAYIFLKDDEGRNLYDVTYQKFKESEKTYSDRATKNGSTDISYNTYKFEFSDEVLKKWMNNAKSQAQKIKEEVIDEFRGAIIESGKSIWNYLLNIFFPMLLVFLLIKSCNG